MRRSLRILLGLGSFEVGAPADLLFQRRDPTHDLSALLEIEAVLADGRLYRRADLDAALARFDRHFHGSLYETAMRLVMWATASGFGPERAHEDPS